MQDSYNNGPSKNRLSFSSGGRGFYPYTCWAQRKQGGKLSSFVKGNLNVFKVALSPDDYINILLLFPTNSHQPNPTNLRLCVGLLLIYAQTKILDFTGFYSPKHFYPPNFFHEASCFHLSLEWMRRHLSTTGGMVETNEKLPNK